MELYSYSGQQIKEAAFRAAKYVVDNLENLPEILTEEFLFERGGIISPPAGASMLSDEFKAWSFVVCTFREEWRKRVHEISGRYPATSHGEGFRLLKPHENADFSEKAAYNAAMRGFKKGKFIIEHTRMRDLNSEDRSKLQNARIRLAALESAVSSTERENQRRRRFKAKEEDKRPSIPSVGGHLPE